MIVYMMLLLSLLSLLKPPEKEGKGRIFFLISNQFTQLQ